MDTSTVQSNLPLSGVRVVELTYGNLETCGRFLADLGAEVLLIEPRGGLTSRLKPPLHDGVSLHFASHNANKRSVELELDSQTGVQSLGALIDTADIFLESTPADWLQQTGLQARLRPDLVTLSLTDFGRSGPYAGFTASNAVLLAMGGVLARSGLKGATPLLPPGELAYETAALQAAWVALAALWNVSNGGLGGCFDFSVYEATLQILDPGMGVTGSAAGGRSALELAPRGRPPIGNGYPIFPCRDGAVRICLLNPRQWQGMSLWLGDDHPFTDPSYANLAKRFKVIREINAVIAELFRLRDVAELVAEGQRRGVPIAAVSTPAQVLEDPHFRARDSFVELSLSEQARGRVPFGFLEIDGQQAGVRGPAPLLGQHTPGDCLQRNAATATGNSKATLRRPFSGLRVLDLGVIVAGAELGRLLADQGAEVIKIESLAYPDGLRQSMDNRPMTISFAQGSRGKQSFGLNLRDPRGIEVFKQLVVQADVVLSNFKPGTLESLGIGYDVLSMIKPDIIMADSSALGNHGPASQSMGYGPLVRAATGLTWLWRYPQQVDGYSDSTTIFPDHFAARVSAAAIAAALLRRKRTGRGGRVSVCQAETILATLATDFLHESIVPGAFTAQGNRGRFDAPDNVFGCHGDDEWCAISVQNDHQWRQLCLAMERADWLKDARLNTRAGRLLQAEELEAGVAQWTAQRTPFQVRDVLQASGVPAGNMLRLDQLADDPQLRARHFFKVLHQPGLDAPLLTENTPALGPLPEPLIRPAPFPGQHTLDIARNLLGLDDSRCAELVREGVLEPASAQIVELLVAETDRLLRKEPQP
ncbi:CoA transferase [Pseudomonas sp. NFACC13-1]|uniref:CaiB/BaiF CoA-transferase family protein n=1 Tax=Pseudomonas sp. NFACC13-1 TaxID=1566245 RepID=UPI0008875350|nr:CoA transferase [Pseudomonas sp. NFACC13-1]SDB35119.1 Crotonobetainyl-CoA:carnitine CoA-transferase CaiB [Pseudomonas sp. NFACC13-1]